jgi:hypothetical protein
MNADPGPPAPRPGLTHGFLAETGLDLSRPHH